MSEPFWATGWAPFEAPNRFSLEKVLFLNPFAFGPAPRPRFLSDFKKEKRERGQGRLRGLFPRPARLPIWGAANGGAPKWGVGVPPRRPRWRYLGGKGNFGNLDYIRPLVAPPFPPWGGGGGGGGKGGGGGVKGWGGVLKIFGPRPERAPPRCAHLAVPLAWPPRGGRGGPRKWPRRVQRNGKKCGS